VGQLNGLVSVPQPKQREKYHWPTVANAALAHTIRDLLPSLKPENLTVSNALEQAFATQFRAEIKQKDSERSVAHGQVVADAILAWAATDGYAAVYHCQYKSTPVPGTWEPTPPAFTFPPLQSCWGQLWPLVLASGAECAPPGHPEFSTAPESEFHRGRFLIWCEGNV
jgi:hypothetical protein